jgi:dienelactone hydrolase
MLAAVVVAASLVGCSGQESDEDANADTSTSEPPASPASPSTTSSPARGDLPYEEVEFNSPDGDVRSGRVFGEGKVGVILSHMGRGGDGQHDWEEFAAQLADRGYLVLTYQRRSDMGGTWQDVLGGADYMRELGVDRVIAGGASLGAMATLYAAGQSEAQFSGIIWLAGVLRNRAYNFEEADVSGLECPMLFISGDEDSYGAAEDSQQMHAWAEAPSDLTLLPSRRHGTDVFEEDGPIPDELTQLMLDWIDQVASESAVTC